MPKMSDYEEWLKAYMVADGDLVQLLNEGEFIPAQETKFGRLAFNILVGLNDQSSKTWGMNKTTRTRLTAAWGEDSANWVGKWVQIKKSQQNVRGEMRDILFGYPYELQPQPPVQAGLTPP